MKDAFDRLAEVLTGKGIPFRREVPLAPLTCLGVGGTVPVFAEPRQVEDVLVIHRTCAALGIRLE